MPSSDARIQANIRNAALSTGPRTESGKQKSRENSLKHGLTGAGVVLPQADAAEVERRSASFARELNAQGDVGHALARRAALNSVRMERGADQQSAALTEHVRKVEAEFEAPEGVDEVEAAELRSEAVRRAMFDPSREATLARRYEAAAERNFFRALKELQKMARAAQVEAKATGEAEIEAMMGSILAAQRSARSMDEEFDKLYPELDLPAPRRPANPAHPAQSASGVDVPITVGRPR